MYFCETFFTSVCTIIRTYVLARDQVESEFSAQGLLYCPDQLELQGVLGEGAFGVVQKGLLCTTNGTTQPVAVKSLKGNYIRTPTEIAACMSVWRPSLSLLTCVNSV